jgi:hypothetical protein
MINPETINPLLLPSLPFDQRRLLPNCPAIYFVLEDGKPIYIGQTKTLLLRWQGHHRRDEIRQSQGVIAIAWLECSDTSLLISIELALIEYFQPRLNHPPRLHGEVKKPKQFLLTPSASEDLDRLAENLKVSRSEYIERVVRGLAVCDEESLSAVYRYLGMGEDGDHD